MIVVLEPWVLKAVCTSIGFPLPLGESRDRVALDPVNIPAAVPGINGFSIPYALSRSGATRTMSPGDAALAVVTLDV